MFSIKRRQIDTKFRRQQDLPGQELLGNMSPFLVFFLVAGLAAITFAGTLSHELVWDDPEVLKYIEKLYQDGGVRALLSSQFATHIEEGYVSGYYRPIPVLSLWLDSRISSFFPGIFHLTNVLLHTANAVLVFAVLRLFLATTAAFFGAAIFAVHPVHSEAVSFVSARTDLWACFLLLCAVFLWLKEQRDDSDLLMGRVLGSHIFFLLACLSKEVAYMLPLVLFSWAMMAQESGTAGWKARLIGQRKWASGWIMVLAGLAVIRLLVFGSSWGLFQSGHEGVSFKPAIIGNMLLTYIRLLVLPWPLKVYYSLQDLRLSWASGTVSMIFLLFLVLVFLRCKNGHAARSVIWIFVFLLPVLMVIPRGGALLAERFLYVPSVGYSLLTGAALSCLPVSRWIAGTGLGMVILVMMSGTMHQNRVWSDEVTLYSEFVRILPEAPGSHFNLGNALSNRGKLGEAHSEFTRTVQIDPYHYRAWFNMGNTLAELGRRGEAVRAYREALEIAPDLVEGYVNLGAVLVEERRFKEAIEVFSAGMQYKPADLRLHIGLILTYLEAGQVQRAREHQKMLEKYRPISFRYRKTSPPGKTG